MMKPDKGRAQVPVNNYDGPQQTSIGAHALQLPPQKGNITGRQTVAKRAISGQSPTNNAIEQADYARPWATITHSKKPGTV